MRRGEFNTSVAGEAYEVGLGTVAEVKLTAARYFALAERDPNNHLSEYVGPQMLGGISRYFLDKYLAKIASGEINTGHGYNEDPISIQVTKELKKLTGSKAVAIVPTGTAANLDLIASFCDSNDEEMKFIACETEHSVNLEEKMLQKAGIKKENMKLMAFHNGIVSVEDLSQATEEIDGKFIFQMAIPSSEGMVPSMKEFRLLIDVVHKKGGYFLVDGARLTNALVHWKVGLGVLTKLGVDGFTLGTSKKGGLAEVVCINDKQAATKLSEEAKSYGHTSSKESPLAFITGIFLTTDLWRKEAESENKSATLFADILKGNGISPEFEVDSNTVFITLSKKEQERLTGDNSEEEQEQLTDENFKLGMLYHDYGPGANISRIMFIGFQSEESVRKAAEVVVKVKKIN